MTKPMQTLAIASFAACSVLGSIGAANAQMHDGAHAAGGAVHGGSGSHRGGESHHGDGFHDGGRFHGRGVFVGPPIIFGPEFYPYGYSDPYDYSYPYGSDPGSMYWYCRDPAGYYPDVQTCPSGWMQVVPNS
jgi:hypothetical protein